MRELNVMLGAFDCLLRIDDELPERIKNYTASRHCNVEYELFVILEGRCVIDVEEESHVLTAGDALLIAPNKFHCPLSTSPDQITFILPFVLQNAPSQKALHRRLSPCVPLRLPASAIELCHSIAKEQTEKPLFWQEAVNAKYALLLTELFRSLPVRSSKKERSTKETADERFSVIDDFFEVYSNRYGSEELLAKRLHVSKRQLGRILKEHYGMSFRQKLMHARMDRAALLLRTTDLSVCEIGEAVGYLSTPSFFKAFKSHHKITPEAYRKELISNGSHTHGND